MLIDVTAASMEGVGKLLLIRQREANDLRLGNGALRRLANGRHHEVADALDLAGAFYNRECFRQFKFQLLPAAPSTSTPLAKSSNHVP